MDQVLDLSIYFTSPPEGSPPEILADITLRFDSAGLTHTGGVLVDSLIPQERESLHWYLEEYVKWPYEQFLERAKQVEAFLPELGKRLYGAVFGNAEAMSIVQAWRLYPLPLEGQRQISIISEVPGALSLPWDLLHDEQGFLTLRTPLIRRLPQQEPAEFPIPFEPPMHILLVTARPKSMGFVDPRSIAHELLDTMQPQVDAGTIDLEFLRPPTLAALHRRMSDPLKPPVHILHFDGHGVADTNQGQGLLAFEKDDGQLDLVEAGAVAQVLLHSGVRLAVLTACQSAVEITDGTFSSVAAQLISSGINAVAAMSGKIQVATATRYVKAFYQALAAGRTAPLAQEQARQALYDDPRRNLHRRGPQDEGTVVILYDWWLPHYYQQSPVSLQQTKAPGKREAGATATTSRLSPDFPPEPRYGFSGRTRELLQIERALLQGKLVIIAGFGGMGKTALAREAADWFTRTEFYDGACFVSFAHGGDAALLLSMLGNYLGINNADYKPDEPASALTRLSSALNGKKLLLVADNLESILPAGEVPLEPAERTVLWNVLLQLSSLGMGVLLTSRNTAFDDDRLTSNERSLLLQLQGLARDDANTLVSRLLTDLNIKSVDVPYAPLQELLAQLDYHPLAIQLVLPALQDLSLDTISGDFAALLPRFTSDTQTGHNRSLLASLDYSLHRLSEEQRTFLSPLVIFEGGANESDLLAITQIPETVWATLRPALEHTALITVERVHKQMRNPFLHFHPVLVPYLRSQQGVEDPDLLKRYARQYYNTAIFLYDQDSQRPEAVRALARRELPNLRRAWTLLVQADDIEAASKMTESISRFLTFFGLLRERDQLRQRFAEALQKRSSSNLTQAEFLHELGIAQEERSRGQTGDALRRVRSLLARIEALFSDRPEGRGSYEHCLALAELADCLVDTGQVHQAEKALGQALPFSEALIAKEPGAHDLIRLRARLFGLLGDALSAQGQFQQAQTNYEEALKLYEEILDRRNQAAVLGQLGMLALAQQNYVDARSHCESARDVFHELGESDHEAKAWYDLGRVAEKQEEWSEAERCYRESLSLKEQSGDVAGVASTCNQLAFVTKTAGRFTEAEGWLKYALERVEPDGLGQAAIFNNLANLLTEQVRDGLASRKRLQEARIYAERALRIREQPGVVAGIWQTFSILAQIAELRGKRWQARLYRRSERESFAVDAGNRYAVDQEDGPLIASIAAAARGDAFARSDVDVALARLEQQGRQITPAVLRIWKGERNWYKLVKNLGREDALLILRVLETLATPPLEW